MLLSDIIKISAAKRTYLNEFSEKKIREKETFQLKFKRFSVVKNKIMMENIFVFFHIWLCVKICMKILINMSNLLPGYFSFSKHKYA